MNKTITKQLFKEIKKCLDRPILMKPSVTYVANKYNYSTGTISIINNSKNYKDYKKRVKRYRMNWLNSHMEMTAGISEERKRAIKEIEDFNNEWFFGGEE